MEHRDRLLQLIDAVGWQTDLAPYQWGQFTAMALEFKPDLIIELGRAGGNSTCVFTEAANILGDCSVVSLCLTSIWERETLRNIAPFITTQWLRPLTALRKDILGWDPEPSLRGKKRVLIFCVAHGFKLAEWVLGRLLPLVGARDNLVMMHDLSDARYHSGAYTAGLWQGGNARKERFRIGNVDSAVEQAIAVVDFTSRNGNELISPEHQMRTDERGFGELERDLGPLFSHQAHWFYFSTYDLKTPTYPQYRRPTFTSQVSSRIASAALVPVHKSQYMASVMCGIRFPPRKPPTQ